MKVLVNEIEKNNLINYLKFFLSKDEIQILEDGPKTYRTSDCECPYYIEENIKDLDNVLKICTDVSYNMTPMGGKINWKIFCLFWALMLSIYKQREIGRKISDLEYLYEKYKNNFKLELTNSFSLNLGFTIETNVLVGESNLGKMFLYKEDEYFSFVFDVEYKSIGIFGKEKNEYTHWHPQDFFEASNDLENFMSNKNVFNLKTIKDK